MGWLFGLRWTEGFLLLDSPGLTHADAISLRLGRDCGSTISLLVCLEAGRLSAWASHFFPLWPLLQANLGSFLGVAGVSAMRERASQVLFRPLLVLCSPFETSHAAAQIQGGEKKDSPSCQEELSHHIAVGHPKGFCRNLWQLFAMYLPVLTGVFS